MSADFSPSAAKREVDRLREEAAKARRRPKSTWLIGGIGLGVMSTAPAFAVVAPEPGWARWLPLVAFPLLGIALAKVTRRRDGLRERSVSWGRSELTLTAVLASLVAVIGTLITLWPSWWTICLGIVILAGTATLAGEVYEKASQRK